MDIQKLDTLREANVKPMELLLYLTVLGGGNIQSGTSLSKGLNNELSKSYGVYMFKASANKKFSTSKISKRAKKPMSFASLLRDIPTKMFEGRYGLGDSRV